MQNTYWNHNGRFNDMANKLQELIPAEGAVKNITKNRALERFRKAVNCYYDLYNNGLCNRLAAFNKLFGIAASNYRYSHGRFGQSFYEYVERKMDQFILDAYAEQFPEDMLALLDQAKQPA